MNYGVESYENYKEENCLITNNTRKIFDSYLIIQHNELLSDKDVKVIKANVGSVNQQYNQ